MNTEPIPGKAPVPPQPLVKISLSELESAEEFLEGEKPPDEKKSEDALNTELEKISEQQNPLP
jgi:hypothetical protein